ncbi:MAG: heme ABC exporter ATP-binding protein CcmA [Alphaproteobacteria bacterium]|nr:heme ABC exporter ATP-binding protein CcmA [Alphaproteobacteria bacterium]
MTSPDHITLDVQHLTVRRASATIISGMVFTLAQGTALLVTGANGSGKTSLLRGLAGLLPVDQGTILINGRPAGEDPLTDKDDMIYIGHRDGLSSGLTAAENIRFWATCRGMNATPDQLTEAFDALGIVHLMASETRHLSEGQRKRVGLVRLALDHQLNRHRATQSLWLMDEPLTAIDSAAAALLARLINAHTAAGGSVVMTTHADIALDRARHLNLDTAARENSVHSLEVAS